MTSRTPPPTCPRCGAALGFGGFVLAGRSASDGRRTCRVLWGCPERHVWWKWADRDSDPLEPCPHPQMYRPG
ncbi:dehydrogenase [Streptomyces sp. NPDC056479]|uniref:dehydrogenase n=1 Tax=unclassified Streptomyces TaxID=2593676 RepID=UPI0036B905EF